MKKILVIITAILLSIQTYSIAASNVSTEVKRGIEAYKKGNYTGSGHIFWDYIAKNPKDVYATYYLGLSSWRLGFIDMAKETMEKALALNPKGDLKLHIENSLLCLSDYEKCKAGEIEFKRPETYTQQISKVEKYNKPNELDTFIGDNHALYFKDVNKEIERKELDVLKYEINTGKPLDSYTFQRYKNYSNK